MKDKGPKPVPERLRGAKVTPTGPRRGKDAATQGDRRYPKGK